MAMMAVAAYEQNDHLVLENSWVRASVDRKAGLLKSLYDKRTQAELLENGVWIEIFSSPASGYFASSIQRRDDGEAAILISGIEWKSRIGWSLEFSLRDDSCALYVAITFFNRGDEKVMDGRLLANITHSAPVALITNPETPVPIFERFRFRIFPYQTVRFRGSLLATGHAGGPAVGDRDAAMIESDGDLRIAFARDIPNCRIHLQFEDGKTLEGIGDCSILEPIKVGLGDNPEPLSSLRVVSQAGEIVAEFRDLMTKAGHLHIGKVILEDAADTDEESDDAGYLSDVLPFRERLYQETLAAMALDPRVSPAAYLQLAFTRMNEQRWAEALSFTTESLIHNSANPIAWWAKHVCAKKLGLEDGEALANAHFLAPHEPLLKAEAFLQQPDSQSRLLESYGGNSQPFREAAEFLATAGLLEELYVWLTEAMNRSDDPMIAVMLAWMHKNAGQEIEAEALLDRVRRSGKIVEPLRPMEKHAAHLLGMWSPPL